MIERKTVSQCYSSDYCKGWNDAVDNMSKWISVDERLPENQFLVLVYVHNSYELVHWNAYDEIWEHKFGWFNKGEVSYWMPLPEPPKENNT